MIISERIFYVMEQKNITQLELSRRTGIATSNISDWKKKKTNPKADCLLSICDALDITPEQLLTGKGIDPEYKDADMDYEVTRADIKILKQIHKEKIKVYLYTRVSTAMQIDGYSLEAQKTKMKAYCDYNEYEIAGEYEDAGKSGKSIEGRIAFNQMMDDIKSGKDRQGVLKVYLKESKKQKCKLIIS